MIPLMLLWPRGQDLNLRLYLLFRFTRHSFQSIWINSREKLPYCYYLDHYRTLAPRVSFVAISLSCLVAGRGIEPLQPRLWASAIHLDSPRYVFLPAGPTGPRKHLKGGGHDAQSYDGYDIGYEVYRAFAVNPLLPCGYYL